MINETLVLETPEIYTGIRPVTFKKISILDLTEQQFNRLQILSKIYATTSFAQKAEIRMSAEEYMLIMMKGLELGISPMAAVDLISIIQGKPTLDAKGLLALVKASGELENINISSSPEKGTCVIKRRNQDEHTEIFTFEDAKRMNLTGRKNYQAQPATMLKWRAVSAACRVVFPDVIGGLYTPEELAPDDVEVDDSGTMRVLPTAQVPAQLPAPTKTEPAVGTAATFLNTDAGKTKLRKWLEEREITNDHQFLLDHFEVSRFSEIPAKSEQLFYSELERVYYAWGSGGQLQPPTTEKTTPKTASKPGSKPQLGKGSPVFHATKVGDDGKIFTDVLRYDGKRVLLTTATGDFIAECYSRTTFAKLVDDPNWVEAFDIESLTVGLHDIDGVYCYYTVKARKDGSLYNQITSVEVYDDAAYTNVVATAAKAAAATDSSQEPDPFDPDDLIEEDAAPSAPVKLTNAGTGEVVEFDPAKIGHAAASRFAAKKPSPRQVPAHLKDKVGAGKTGVGKK